MIVYFMMNIIKYTQIKMRYMMLKNIMEKEISNFISTEIEWVPINKIKLKQEDKEKMLKFLEILEEDEDVQNVFTNAV